MFIKHLTSKKDNILSCFCINMNLCCKLVVLLLLVFNSSEQDCPDIDKRVSHNAIPFILPISTETEKCHGIIISRNYILTNAKCVNGSVAAKIHLGSRKNAPSGNTDNVQTPENIIIHDNFLQSPSTYDSDWALLKLQSSLNFSLALKPATFLLNDENFGSTVENTAAIAIWKAGYLRTTLGVIQKTESCVRVFGQDFQPANQFCALISDDIFITHVDGCVSHPLLINGSIVGFAIPDSVLDKDGRVYRILRLSSVINWVKNYTNINQDEEFINDLHQDVESCLFQNIDSRSFENSSLTLNSILNQLIQEQVKDLRSETKAAIESIQLKLKGTIQAVNELNNTLIELQSKTNPNTSGDAQNVLSTAKSYVDNKRKEINNDVHLKYQMIQNLLSEKEELILSKVNDKYLKIEALLHDKGKELNDIMARLSRLERKMNTKN